MKQRCMVGVILLIATFLLALSFPTIVNWRSMKSISNAEVKWNAGQLNSYQVNGQANWGWHEHTFQITVVNGKIIESECNVAYDRLEGERWCETQFEAAAHLVPALYDKAREMIEFGSSISPTGNCFRAEFDKSNGAPNRLLLDCANASDEQEEWIITVSEYVP